MAKPTTFTWASDANYTAPGKSWDGTPTKVAPAAGNATGGYSPKDPPAAQVLNWILNLLGLWTAYLAGSQTDVISGMAMLPFGAGTVSYTYNDGVANVTDALDVAVGLELPLGATITAIRARLKDNFTGPTKLSLFLADADGSGGVVLSAAAASAGDGTNQTLSVAGLATVVASGHSYAIVVGTTTGTAACNVYSVEVDWTPG